MKKMIRQFAIEYISKSSKIQENRNGSSFEPSLICKSIQMNQTENSLQEEQDSPLDLTVNRTQEQNTQQGKLLYLLICVLLSFITYVLWPLKKKVCVKYLYVLSFQSSNHYIGKKLSCVIKIRLKESWHCINLTLNTFNKLTHFPLNTSKNIIREL